MNRAKRKAQAILRQWPAVIAESLGLRSESPMRAAPGGLPDPEQWRASQFAACWLGHATALLRLGQTTIITDPHFEDRAGVSVAGRRIGRRRVHALPGLVENLPSIDVVLLSHAHLDHWDRASLTRLADSRTAAVIPRGTRRLLPRGFGEVVEIDWDSTASAVAASPLRVRAIKPNHWGARWLLDRRRGYNAYLIEYGRRRVLYTGDTAETSAFDSLASDDPAGVDLAVMGVGGYHTWNYRHATPEQVAEMASRMGARLIMPVHHSTFHDEAEPPGEAIDRLRAVWREDSIICPQVGGAWFAEPEDTGVAGDGSLIASAGPARR